MAWRYRELVRFLSGVHLNGVRREFASAMGEVSLNPRATLRGARCPGAGYSGRARGDGFDRRLHRIGDPSAAARSATLQPPVPVRQISAIGSAAAAAITSPRLQSLRLMLIRTAADRSEVAGLLNVSEQRLAEAQRRLRRREASWLVRTLFPGSIPRARHDVATIVSSIDALRRRGELCTVDADFPMGEDLRSSYESLRRQFETLTRSDRVWDVAPSHGDAGERRSDSVVQRRDVEFDFVDLEILQSRQPALRMRNANGGELYLYPAWLVYLADTGELAVVEINDVSLEYLDEKIAEPSGVPADAIVVDRSWTRVNADGSPDLTVSENRQIPVALYGRLRLVSTTGLRADYLVSDADAASAFAEAFGDYRSHLAGRRVGPGWAVGEGV